MNIRVHKGLKMLRDEWIASAGFLENKKKVGSVADEHFDLLRKLIPDPRTEVDEKHWQIIKDALLVGLQCRNTVNESDSKLHVYCLTFAIAGFIKSETPASHIM